MLGTCTGTALRMSRDFSALLKSWGIGTLVTSVLQTGKFRQKKNTSPDPRAGTSHEGIRAWKSGSSRCHLEGGAGELDKEHIPPVFTDAFREAMFPRGPWWAWSKAAAEGLVTALWVTCSSLDRPRIRLSLSHSLFQYAADWALGDPGPSSGCSQSR